VQPVVLDTTAFYPWEVQRPPALERLFLGGRRYELRLCVPEVVIRETTRHFSRRVNPAYNSFKDGYRAAKAAGTLPPELDIDFKRPPKADVVSAYERSLRNDIGDADGRVLPVPEVDHDWVLGRIFGPLKPSKPGDDSYRDILIWKTVVALVSEDPTKDVIFITKNTTDFARRDRQSFTPSSETTSKHKGFARSRLSSCVHRRITYKPISQPAMSFEQSSNVSRSSQVKAATSL
jgi:hypothetical protein